MTPPEYDSDSFPADTPAEGDDSLCLLVAQVAEAVNAEFAAGRTPDPEALAARFSQSGGQVRDLVVTLSLLHDLGTGESDWIDGAREPDAGYRLGEYRIVREVGRGGMGVVYEAIEPALKRRVALKVLPRAAVLDLRRLQRFRAEAQAAAGLSHPNIVPVYATGCAGGVHYIAMQFVAGRSLAVGIAERRQGGGPPSDPESLRDVARLGAEVADALEYAHQCGVVHRDIKPANLLRDESGRVWVTDFGLARLPDESGVTLSGDLVGTLRYMSPEQALARHGLVDHRADVFALGATLYELLTLEPVRSGTERQELLRQVATEEPRPVRKLNWRVPVDLETVVMKALRREPAERYASARELADDLRRWLDGRPIAARPPGVWERLQWWARRHRAAVVATVAALVVCTAVLAAATVVALSQRDDARHHRTEAERQTGIANERLEEFRREYARAEQQTTLANTERDKARRRRDQALRAANVTVESVWKLLSLRPRLNDEQRKLMQRAVEVYRELAVEEGADPAVRLEAVRALKLVGDIWSFLEHPATAVEHYREAIGRLEPLLRELPNEQSYRVEMAELWTRLSGALGAADAPIRKGVAEGAAREADRRWDELACDGTMNADLRNKRAVSLARLGNIHCCEGRFADAEGALSRACEEFAWLTAEFPDNVGMGVSLASTHVERANLWLKQGKLAEAMSCLQDGLRVSEQLAKRFPNSKAVRELDGTLRHNLGFLLACLGRPREAETEYERSLVILREMVREKPYDPQGWHQLATTQKRLTHLLVDRGDFARATAMAHEWCQTCQQQVRDDPASGNNQVGLAEAHGLLGYLVLRTGRLDEALKQYEMAIRLQEAITRTRTDWEAERPLALNQISYATCLSRAGRRAEAEAVALVAVGRFERVLRQQPTTPDVRLQSGLALHALATIRCDRGDFAGALAPAEKAKQTLEQLSKEQPQKAGYRDRAKDADTTYRRALAGACPRPRSSGWFLD
jgi:tetratricopeptide (TPR) repeat protein/tRNA A-37 threonylcarbamoyl transferase component Bud32